MDVPPLHEAVHPLHHGLHVMPQGGSYSVSSVCVCVRVAAFACVRCEYVIVCRGLFCRADFLNGLFLRCKRCIQ